MKIERVLYTSPSNKTYVKKIIVTMTTMEDAFKLVDNPSIISFITDKDDNNPFYVNSKIEKDKLTITVSCFQGSVLMPEDVDFIEKLFTSKDIPS
jgi:hypothetical protein